MFPYFIISSFFLGCHLAPKFNNPQKLKDVSDKLKAEGGKRVMQSF